MLQSLLIAMGGVMALSIVTMAALKWAFHAPRYASHHFHAPVNFRPSMTERVVSFLANSVLSNAMLFGAALLFYRAAWFYEGGPAWWAYLVEPLAVLLIYDFVYYWYHRALHIKGLMKLIHRVHHLARNPSATESLYVHPFETFGGLAILLGAVWLVGPVHWVSFIVIFIIHSQVNIIIHTGIEFPSYPMKIFNPLIRAHYRHHMTNINRNYASMSPIWDALFRTRA